MKIIAIAILTESSRLVSPNVTGWGLFSLFSAWFPGGATIFRPWQTFKVPSARPLAFRPTLTDGLALSRIKILKPPKDHKTPLEAYYRHLPSTSSHNYPQKGV